MHAIVNLRAKLARERALNRILPDLQKEFEKQLVEKDTPPALGPADFDLINEIMDEELADLG